MRGRGGKSHWMRGRRTLLAGGVWIVVGVELKVEGCEGILVGKEVVGGFD